MAVRTDTFDLAGLRLGTGEGRHLQLDVAIEPFALGGERYPVDPRLVPVRLDISRTSGHGYALRLRFEAASPAPACAAWSPPRRGLRSTRARSPSREGAMSSAPPT